ncbi:hypothetical protein AURDEDRAFT_174797, partial [Auricularia subglabra TFB-10046 SS5]
MGPKAVLDVSSPPKAASSAAALDASSEPSRTPSSSPEPSPAPAGEVSGDVVAGPVPLAAVAAIVPSGGIVPPAPPVVAPAGAPAPLLAPATATPVAPARVSESDGDAAAAVLDVLAAADDDVVGEGPATSSALLGLLLESVPETSAARGSPASVAEVVPPTPLSRVPPL